jgi:predicted nucleotidyltransferase
MSDSEAQVLGFIRDRLSNRFDIKRMVLFGSRASGTAAGDSDYDVLVVADSEIPFIRRQGVAMQELGPHSEPVDLLVYTPEEAEEAARKLGSAVYWAEREGQVFLG